MQLRNFIGAILAVLGIRLMPTQSNVCRQPTCDKYGTRHLDWHSQYMYTPKVYTATDLLRDRERYLTSTHAWYLKVELPPETRWMYIDR